MSCSILFVFRYVMIKPSNQMRCIRYRRSLMMLLSSLCYGRREYVVVMLLKRSDCCGLLAQCLILIPMVLCMLPVLRFGRIYSLRQHLHNYCHRDRRHAAAGVVVAVALSTSLSPCRQQCCYCCRRLICGRCAVAVSTRSLGRL